MFTLNVLKTALAGVLAVVLIAALAFTAFPSEVGLTLLGTLIGYVVGNSQITTQTGKASPIVTRSVQSDV